MPHAASILLPTDADERRRLWREWIEQDVPGDRMPIRRASAAPEPDAGWIGEAVPHQPSLVAGVRSAIEASVVDGQLSLSDRRRLMSRAMRLGLSRFEASLLIAAVLHRSDAPPSTRGSKRRMRWTVSRIVFAILLLEVVAAMTAATLLR